jgi:hypothetical protein
LELSSWEYNDFSNEEVDEEEDNDDDDYIDFEAPRYNIAYHSTDVNRIIQ